MKESKLNNTTSSQFFLTQAINPEKLALLTPKEVVELVKIFCDNADSLAKSGSPNNAIKWYQIAFNILTNEAYLSEGFVETKAKVLRSLALTILTLNEPDKQLIGIAENASKLVLDLDKGFCVESFYIRLKLLDVKQPVNKSLLKQGLLEIIDNLTVLSRISDIHIEVVIKCAQLVAKYDHQTAYGALKGLLDADDDSLTKPRRVKLFMGILAILSSSLHDSSSAQIKEAISILLTKMIAIEDEHEIKAMAVIGSGAKRAFEAGKYAEAAELYKLSFDVCKGIEFSERAAMLRKIGLCHLEDSQYDQAQIIFDQALALERNSLTLTLKLICSIRSKNLTSGINSCI